MDDAHWADAPSLRFLVYLARRLEGVPVLVAVTARMDEGGTEGELVAALAAEPGVRLVTPRPLSEDAVRALVEEGVGDRPDRDFARACHAATGGNPLLVRELVLELRERAVKPVASEASGLEDLAIDGVARPVLRRLERLPAGAGALARAVAVLGDGADLGAAARLAELRGERAHGLADALARAGVLEPGVSLRFVHPLVRAAVAGSLGPGERDATHRRAARILAEAGDFGDRVAAHLAVARPAGEPWALDVLTAAGRRAAARGAPDAAAALLRRALAEQPGAAARQSLLVELGEAEAHASDPAAIEHLEQALEAAPAPAERTRAALALGAAFCSFGRYPEAVAVYERTIDHLGPDEPELALDLEAELLSVAPLDLSTRAIAMERISRIDPDIAPSSRSACRVLACLARDEMVRAGSPRRAIELAERSLAGGYLLADDPIIAFPHAPLVMSISGALERAMQVYDEMLARTRARGAVLSAALLAALRGLAEHQLGRLADAADDERAALEAAETYGAPLIAPWAAGFYVSTLIAQGELEEADAVIGRVAGVAAMPEAFAGVHVLSNRGRLRIAQRRLDEAAADLRECARRLEGWESRNPGLTPWRGEMALVEHLRGRSEEARELAADNLARARGWSAPWVVVRALRVSGVIEGDAGLLREAVEVAAAGGARLEHARALVDLGALLRRSGARRASREPLREGLDVALACGARPVAARAQSELVASGAQPRRLRTSGPDALTPAERRVAAMAADGLTNRAIAQSLFVSEKTVETHMRSVFRKLDVASRSQLVSGHFFSSGGGLSGGLEA